MAFQLPLPDLGVLLKKYVSSFVLLIGMIAGFPYVMRYTNQVPILANDQSMIPAIGMKKGTATTVRITPPPVDISSLEPFESIVVFRHPTRADHFCSAREVNHERDRFHHYRAG